MHAVIHLLKMDHPRFQIRTCSSLSASAVVTVIFNQATSYTQMHAHVVNPLRRFLSFSIFKN